MERVDGGSPASEVTVVRVVIQDCYTQSRTVDLSAAGSFAPVERDKEPVAWLEVDGILDILGRTVIFRRG